MRRSASNPSARVTIALSMAALACPGGPFGPGDEPSGALAGEIRVVSRVVAPYGHVTKLLVEGDLLYTTIGTRAVGTWDLSDGKLRPIEPAIETPPGPCSTLALHARSRSLFCAHAFGAGVPFGEPPENATTHVLAFDVSDRGRPRARPDRWLPWPERFTRDSAVVGDFLVLANLDLGFQVARIGDDGALSGPRLQRPPGRPHLLAPLGDDALLALMSDGLLVRYAVDASGVLRETDRLALEGPPLDLRATNGLAFVALGSAGGVVVDARGPALVRRHDLRPGCTVMSGDARPDAVAVACPGSLLVYDMRDGRQRLVGIGETEQAFMSVLWHGDDLVASDWNFVVRLRPSLDVEAVAVSAPRGIGFNAGARVRVPVRNLGTAPVRAELRFNGETLAEPVTVQPGALGVIDGTALPGLPPGGNGMTRLDVFATRAADGVVARRTLWTGLAEPPRQVVPMLGATLSPKAALDLSGAPVTNPVPGRRERLVFMSSGCQGQWPLALDLAWLARGDGTLPDGSVPVMVHARDDRLPAFAEAFSLGRLSWAVYDPSTDRTPDEFDPGKVSYTTIAERLGMYTGLGGPDLSLELAVSERGVVDDMQMLYDGFFLRLP